MNKMDAIKNKSYVNIRKEVNYNDKFKGITKSM